MRSSAHGTPWSLCQVPGRCPADTSCSQQVTQAADLKLAWKRQGGAKCFSVAPQPTSNKLLSCFSFFFFSIIFPKVFRHPGQKGTATSRYVLTFNPVFFSRTTFPCCYYRHQAKCKVCRAFSVHRPVSLEQTFIIYNRQTSNHQI